MTDDAMQHRRRRSFSGVSSVSRLRASAPRAATIIYLELRDDIVSLRRKPLELLSEKELAAQFDVSRTPIREAILRLSDDGLVDIFPQSGTFVARIPRRALYEAILIRKALEETTVRLATEKATPPDLQLLEQNLADLSRYEKEGNHPAFHDTDTAFHHHISKIAGFPGIWTTVQHVKVQLDRYRMLTLPQEGRLARVVEEHGTIFEHIRAGNRDAAAAAMGQHLGQMLHEVDNMETMDPDYFIEDGDDQSMSSQQQQHGEFDEN
ncbi:MAG: GntR family transcriptional regulator [Phyllobacterium sp.]